MGFRDRGCDARSIDTWSRRAKRGVSGDERDEPVRLRSESRMLSMERDLLSRAGLFFADRTSLRKRRSRSSMRESASFSVAFAFAS